MHISASVHRGPLGYLKCFIPFIYLFIHSFLHVNSIWRAEDNLQKLVLSFHHVGPKNQTQVRGKHLHLLNHLAGPLLAISNQKLKAYCFKINLCPQRLSVLISQ